MAMPVILLSGDPLSRPRHPPRYWRLSDSSKPWTGQAWAASCAWTQSGATGAGSSTVVPTILPVSRGANMGPTKAGVIEYAEFPAPLAHGASLRLGGLGCGRRPSRPDSPPVVACPTRLCPNCAQLRRIPDHSSTLERTRPSQPSCSTSNSYAHLHTLWNRTENPRVHSSPLQRIPEHSSTLQRTYFR
jgi:hypothetical protein